MSDDTQQMVFSIEKLYVKDMSLEVPGAPQVFMQPEQPQLEVQIEHQVTAINEAMFEVALIISVMLAGGPEKAGLARDTIFAAVMIIVNGVVVWNQGRSTGAHPGRVLTRAKA